MTRGQYCSSSLLVHQLHPRRLAARSILLGGLIPAQQLRQRLEWTVYGFAVLVFEAVHELVAFGCVRNDRMSQSVLSPLAATVHSELVEPACGALPAYAPCKRSSEDREALPGGPTVLPLPFPTRPAGGAAKMAAGRIAFPPRTSAPSAVSYKFRFICVDQRPSAVNPLDWLKMESS